MSTEYEIKEMELPEEVEVQQISQKENMSGDSEELFS
jgi:hypothetical protein